MDKSSDWANTRPTIIGTDPFRSLTFFHFPEMLGSETPRIFQYSFPPSHRDNIVPSAPTSSPQPAKVIDQASSNKAHYTLIPGTIIRLPMWMDSGEASYIRDHLIHLMEREIDVLLTRCSVANGENVKKGNKNKAVKKDKSKMKNLLALTAAFKDSQAETIKGKGSRSKAKRRKVIDKPVESSAPTFNSDLQLANFAFVNRMSCGPVPASAVYARQGEWGSLVSVLIDHQNGYYFYHIPFCF